MNDDLFAAARRIAIEGLTSAYPAAAVEVGRHDRVLWQEAFGRLTHDVGAPVATLDTVFDLASLTKVLATTTLAAVAVEGATLDLASPVSRHLSFWRGADRRTVTVTDLLAHASGLTAHLPFYRDHRGRADFEHAICTLPLEYTPRTASVYSDLGFILLGFILEDVAGAPLASQFARLARERGWEEIGFTPDAATRTRTAPTGVDAWRGRLLVGEVHDENAWALGGVAGHAGLFATARGVGAVARDWLAGWCGRPTFARPDTLAGFTRRPRVPGSTRALGWDTMKHTSSCGTQMSACAVGHTGFTGTSLWLDPAVDVYVVLLTNRVYPSRSNDAVLAVRPAFHDAVMTALR